MHYVDFMKLLDDKEDYLVLVGKIYIVMHVVVKDIRLCSVKTSRILNYYKERHRSIDKK
jgi:hypothetical protein